MPTALWFRIGRAPWYHSTMVPANEPPILHPDDEISIPDGKPGKFGHSLGSNGINGIGLIGFTSFFLSYFLLKISTLSFEVFYMKIA